MSELIHCIGIDPGKTGYASTLTFRQGSLVNFACDSLSDYKIEEFMRALRQYFAMPDRVYIVQEQTEKFVGNPRMQSSHGVAYGEHCGYLKGFIDALRMKCEADVEYEVIRAKDWMNHFAMKKVKGENPNVWKKRLRDKAVGIIPGHPKIPVKGGDSALLALLANERALARLL